MRACRPGHWLALTVLAGALALDIGSTNVLNAALPGMQGLGAALSGPAAIALLSGWQAP
ncbi:hypothetical protein AB0B57_12740 [Micromonospora sp. NPDC049101]